MTTTNPWERLREAVALCREMFVTAESWSGPTASSHNRSEIAGRIRNLEALAALPPAQPEAAPVTDAEVEAAMHRIAVTAIAYDRSPPDSPREEATMHAKADAFDALRKLIARRVAEPAARQHRHRHDAGRSRGTA